MNESHDINELDKKYVDDEPSTEFASLLEEDTASGKGQEVSAGQRISGTIQKIDGSSVFVDYGGRSEAVMDAQELKNDDGELLHQVGDTLNAFVASTEGEVRLTLSLRTSSAEVLRQAYQNGIPVDGRVTGFNSGGLVVNLGGRRAFCPVSQIDTSYSEDLAAFAGQTLTFKIVEFRGNGRNIVLSRRALLEAETQEQANELRKTLAEGQEIVGKITRLERFGAFTDIGGLEGLIHVSELNHSRVEHPQDVLAAGQEVRVKILELKNLGEKNERISLSIKALLPDPWNEAIDKFREGDVLTGKIVSVQQFGAFVELTPGVEGLVHVSQLASSRVARPADVVSVGQEVQVKIQRVEREQKRISLSMRAIQEDAQDTAETQEVEEFKAKSQAEKPATDNSMSEALRRAGLLE
ncbi:MAG: 30S ribosomal protein S1 [bacterium]|nr:30S ribosomal protein S1 [bacterium]